LSRSTSSPRYPHVALLIALVLLGLACTGCPQRIARPDDALTSPNDILSRTLDRHTPISDLRLQSKGDYWDTAQGQRVVGRPISILAASPASLRIQIGSGFGSTLGALASDGSQFSMLDLQNNVFYFGPATPENLSMLLPIYLSGADLVRVLSGGFPTSDLPPDWTSQATLDWNAESGQYRLSVPRTDGQRQVIELTYPDLAVAEIRIESASGDLHYLYQAKDFQVQQGVPLPQKVRFELPTREIDLQLRIEKTETNVSLPESLFTISAPPGVEQIPLR
jgi:hypothetical protein